LHVGKAEFYPLPAAVEGAFEAADALVVEVDLAAVSGSATAALIRAKGRLPSDERLSDVLSEGAWRTVHRGLIARGLLDEHHQRAKPWLLALVLATHEMRRLGYAEEYGVDRYFLGKAKAGKPIIPAETLEYQIGLLDSLSRVEQEVFLLETVRELDDAGRYYQALVDAWRAGDAARLDGLLAEGLRATSIGRRVHELLVVERNAAMADRLETLLAQGKDYFVVFGAGHMVGESGLVEILRARGYRVIPQ
jgi:uncharacterized protein YbaP (TraB family)